MSLIKRRFSTVTMLFRTWHAFTPRLITISLEGLPALWRAQWGYSIRISMRFNSLKKTSYTQKTRAIAEKSGGGFIELKRHIRQEQVITTITKDLLVREIGVDHLSLAWNIAVSHDKLHLVK